MATMLGRALLAGMLLVGAAIAGTVVSFLLTPLLWSLEGPLGVELAGHSGPADWVFLAMTLLIWMICIAVWAVAAKLQRRQTGPK